MTNVFDVAKYILEKSGGIMTAMKLQKLVYYAQAWHLVWEDAPLFRDRIEAWANGPVCPALYAFHRGMFHVATSDLKCGDSRKLSTEAKNTIDSIFEFYGDKDTQWLVALTHMEAPWLNARKGVPVGAPSKNEITLASMAEYYGSIST